MEWNLAHFEVALEIFICSLKQTQCEKIRCPYGSKCVESSGECICRTACHRKGIAVCGTDSVSYPTECHLSIRSCKNTKLGKPEIRMKHYEQQNPCADLQCGPGSECLVSEVNGVLSGRCQCPETCDDYGDSVESSPVCASDGHDYESLCLMRLHACKTQENITVKFYGRCDPCEGFKCALGTVCKLNAERKPECRCSEQCSLERRPVCASDGNTYENECLMLVSACRSDTVLRIISKGHCTGENPCAQKRCGTGQKCFIHRNGTAVCRCRAACPPIMRPVCGLDEKTYDNECELKRRACEMGIENHVRYYSSCGLGICADSSLCKPPKICVLRNNQPVCECEQCSSQLDQVCASDGITYSNPCKMRLEACRTGKEIFKRYRGVCEGCANVKCEYYSYCMADNLGVGRCRCVEDCSAENQEAVCATDGITYESECHMRKAACEQQKFVMVSFKGSCDSCSNVVCPYGQKCEDGSCSCPTSCPDSTPYQAVVCGEDGVLYQSECHLQKESCLSGAPIQIRPYEECTSGKLASASVGCNSENCSYGGFCVDMKGNGIEECICDFSCNVKPNSEICASDGAVYNSTCYMDLMSCKQQKPIYVNGPLVTCVYADECGCNRVGSYDSNCDADGQCRCRPGVGGLKCDHCVSGFWGIHLIVRGAVGCQPCGCSAYGSSRTDCEQSSGRCQCKNGASGEKCKNCAPDSILTSSGCVPKEEYRAPRDCESTQCLHGAKCVISATDMPDCICPRHCSVDHFGMVANMTVCGSDGNTYENMCELMQFACTHQLDLVPASLGVCDSARDKDDIFMRRERKKEEASGIGSFCTSDEECRIEESFCLKKDLDDKGICACKIGYQFFRSSKQCIPAIDLRPESKICHGVDCETDSLRIDAKKSLEVEIWLKVLAPDGLVFYWPKLNKNKIYDNGDFVALVIIAYQPHFFWNLGSGISYVKASSVLSSHRFYSIRFGRFLRNGTIQVDSGFVARQSSLPKNQHLDVYGSDLFIGGVPDQKMLPSFISEFVFRFKGAIQQLSINGIIYAEIYKDLRKAGDVRFYEGAPCLKGICGDGFCFAKLNNFTCQCPPDTSGSQCEKKGAESNYDVGAYFTGDSEYSYFNRVTHGLKGQRSVKFSFWFKTAASEGLIWWENKGASIQNDYLGLFLHNGRLGRKNRVELRVDAESNLYFAPENSTGLNSDGVVWIGGKKQLPSELPLRSLFRGCIKKVLIEGYRLRLQEDVLSTKGPSSCSE
ncbi:unnamed protein product [Enterobius vermicularis]|uniref:Agrin n=1 Tax=Enterobius vermicularis TaxID=51028 RepID=A0A158Q9J3_ENTVE|nr:unnamed protein product [Enterobius vermicularis]